MLLRLSLPPHDAEGAIYVRCRLRLRYLIRQLGISLLCGDVGAECLCYVNGMEFCLFVALLCFWFLFCKCLGIPNSPRSLDLDDRQGLIARSAMQQKKKYVNGMELSNDREMAVDDAAFIMLGTPGCRLRRGRLDHNRGLDLSTFADVHMPVSEFALPSPCGHLRDGAPS